MDQWTGAPAPGPPPRRRRRVGPLQRVLSFVLVAVGAWLLVGAAVLWWIDRTVLDGERVADAVAGLLDQAVVSDALVRGITEELPIDPALTAQVQPYVEQVVASPRFAALYREALADAHAQLLDGDDPVVGLDLTPVVQEVRAVVAAQSPEAAAAIPDAPLVLEVIEREQLPGVWEPVTKADDLVLPLVLLGAGAVLLGAVLAPRWWIPLAMAALVVAGGAFAVGLVVRTVTDRVDDLVPDPRLASVADVVVEAATDGLADQARTVAVVALVAGVVVVVIGAGTDLARRRRPA